MTNLYIDCADRDVSVPLLQTGLFAGLTTNPTLLRSNGLGNDDIAEVVRWATAGGAQTVFVQAWGPDASSLVRRGRALRALGDNVVVKVPATRAGLEATAQLEADGVPVLVTAVYAAQQALPAISAAAHYIAPYLGRMNDAGRDGFEEIAAMQRVVTASGSDLRILVASIRSVDDTRRLAELGVRHLTVSPKVWDGFFEDPLTAEAVAGFEQASSQGARS